MLTNATSPVCSTSASRSGRFTRPKAPNTCRTWLAQTCPTSVVTSPLAPSTSAPAKIATRPSRPVAWAPMKSPPRSSSSPRPSNRLVTTKYSTTALAQTFAPVAETASAAEVLSEFTMATNHLKSKGSECGSEGDNTHLVGSCDAERTAAALVDWVDAEDMPRPVITGDLNTYDQEAPITTLKDGCYTDLREHFDGEEAYSHVFDGQLGYLDYAIAGEELMPFVTGAASWHANSDEVPIFDYTTRFKQPAQQSRGDRWDRHGGHECPDRK